MSTHLTSFSFPFFCQKSREPPSSDQPTFHCPVVQFWDSHACWCFRQQPVDSDSFISEAALTSLPSVGSEWFGGPPLPTCISERVSPMTLSLVQHCFSFGPCGLERPQNKSFWIVHLPNYVLVTHQHGGLIYPRCHGENIISIIHFTHKSIHRFGVY